MSDSELMHSGRKGMKWYQHIFTQDKAQLGNRVTKLDERNKHLESRATRATAKSATYKVMSRKHELKSEKLARGVHLFGKQRSQAHAIKATKLSIRSAEFERTAARARDTIQRNKRLQEKLNTKMSELDSATVQLGEDFLERQSR